MPRDQVEPITGVSEQPEIERREWREAQAARLRAVDPGAASPVGGQPCAEPVVRPTRLRFNLMTRAPPARAERVPMQIVQLRKPRADRDLIDEVDGVGQRKL
jgi:hypothetical protein